MTDQKTKNLKLAARILQAGVVAGICVLAWLFLKSNPSPVPAPSEPAPKVPAEAAAAPALEPRTATSLEQQWGLQILGLSLTNKDTAVQVRYTVVAPDKLLLLSETNASAYLIDQATGAKLPMITPPQAATTAQGASLRTTRRMARMAGQFPPPSSRLMTNRVYSLEIPNWGSAIQSGSKVSLVVNDFRQDGLTVE